MTCPNLHAASKERGQELSTASPFLHQSQQWGEPVLHWRLRDKRACGMAPVPCQQQGLKPGCRLTLARFSSRINIRPHGYRALLLKGHSASCFFIYSSGLLPPFATPAWLDRRADLGQRVERPGTCEHHAWEEEPSSALCSHVPPHLQVNGFGLEGELQTESQVLEIDNFSSIPPPALKVCLEPVSGPNSPCFTKDIKVYSSPRDVTKSKIQSFNLFLKV